MSSVQSEIPRLAKKQKNSFQMEIIQLIETEITQLLDLKYKDMSTVIMEKFKVLMENMDLMVEEIKESLKSDLKETLGVTSTIPEMENPKNSSTRKEWQQIKDTTLIKTGLAEKIGENYVENLTFKRKKIIELSSKSDEVNDGKELSPNESQNHKVMENMEEAIGNIDDTGLNCNIHTEVTGEGREHGEDILDKEMREENIPQNFKNKEKILKASEEDEGAILTLTADFSSATLNVSEQWSNVFNILRENDFEPKLLCQVKLAFKCDGEIRTFSDMQSLSKFTSQKSFMKELLKGVLPENEKIKKGRRYGIQEKVDKTLTTSKHGAGEVDSGGLSFLFIKEVKVAEPEEVKNLEIHEEKTSEWKEKEALEEKEASELEEEEKEALESEEGEETSEIEEESEEASDLEDEEKETLELEEREETSELEEESEEASDLEDEEKETLELEEGEDTSEVEEESDEASGLEEEEEASVLCKEQHSTFQSYTMENTKHGVEIASDALKNILTKEVEDSEQEEEESSECELEEGKDSEVEMSEKTDLVQETEENFRKSVISSFREIQKEIGNIKNYHPRNKSLVVATLSDRIDTLEERINNLEDRIEELSKDTLQMAKQIIVKERIRDKEDRSRSSNIRLIGIPEKHNKENGAEEIVKEIIEENFAELRKNLSLEIVSAYRVPSKIDEKRLTPRHILVKLGNCSDKEKILNASREKKEITYRGTRIRLTADLSLDTLDARSQWGSLITVLQAKGFKPRILYPAKLAFDFEGKTKIFFDIQEFRKFISCVPSLKKLLENIL